MGQEFGYVQATFHPTIGIQDWDHHCIQLRGHQGEETSYKVLSLYLNPTHLLSYSANAPFIALKNHSWKNRLRE